MEYFTNSQPGYAGPDKTYGGLFGGGFCKLLCPFLGKIATGCVFVALLFILLALILGKAIFTALTRRSMEGISNIRERQRIRREEETREYEEMLRRGENDGYYDEDDSEPGYEDESGFDDDHDSYNDEDEDEQDFEFPEHLMTSGRAAARNGERTVGYSDAERRRYLSKLRKEARKKQKAEGDSFLGRLLSKYKSGAGHIEDTPEYKEFKEKYGVSDHEMGEIIADALQKTSRRLGSETEYTEDDFTEDIEEIGEHESSSGYSASDGYTGKDVEVTADAEEQDIVSRELDKKFGETKKIQVINLRERDRSISDKPKHFFIDEDPDSAGMLDQDELDENLKRQIERFYDDDYPQENNGSSENDRNAENSDASGKDTDVAGEVNTAVHDQDNRAKLKNTITSDKALDTTSGNEPHDREVSGATGFNTPEQIKAVMEAAEEKKKNVPYEFPPYDLLKKNEKAKNVDHNELDEMVHKLQASLESFGVKVRVGDATCGPTVTRYEVYPEQGVKVKNITALTDDIKLALAVPDIRIEAPIPGKAAVGIEVPNKTRTPVSLRELIDSDEFRKVPSKLTCAIGKDIGGKIICADIAAMPHALVAGSTGSGKSVCINSMILSILYKAKPSEVRLILIDPKRVELVGYNGIPHLLVPVVTDVKKATGALNWAVAEMDDRYNRFADVGVSNLASYNRLMEEKYYEEGGTEEECPDRLPQILIIIDEFCDLMMTGNPKEVEAAVGRLTQLARACGIHLVIATQRPAVNVITGTIKANIPSRISFSLTSVVDSRTILDQAGAEKLLGKGDMLFSPQEYPQPVRLQGAYVSDKEIADVVKFVKDRCKENMYSDDVNKKIELSASQDNKGQTAGNDGSSKPQDDDDRDELFEEAGKLIIENKKASIGSIQRKYRLGFNRAARIMDQLAEAGVVGPEEGTKPRQILMTIDQFEAMLAGEDAQDQGEGE
ncbi:MAG: DNA translocase FtsK [Lachnospiraceae bacterium]|nr:DNA translocase FtsK [Lachnospiraceae bacterium]